VCDLETYFNATMLRFEAKTDLLFHKHG